MQGGSPNGNDDDRKASSLIDARRQRMDDERLRECPFGMLCLMS